VRFHRTPPTQLSLQNFTGSDSSGCVPTRQSIS
jgi:hypothetical protein